MVILDISSAERPGFDILFATRTHFQHYSEREVMFLSRAGEGEYVYRLRLPLYIFSSVILYQSFLALQQQSSNDDTICEKIMGENQIAHLPAEGIQQLQPVPTENAWKSRVA